MSSAGGDSIYNRPHTHPSTLDHSGRSIDCKSARHFLRADVDNIMPLTSPGLAI